MESQQLMIKEKENVDKSIVSASDSVKECKDKENVTDVQYVSSPQRSSEWFSKRIGKVTSSKASAVIGLQGKKEFQETWDCIKNKKAEPTKNFRNYDRGIRFYAEAAKCFPNESDAVVKECGMYCLESDQRYGASPDRTFLGETCRKLMEVKTGREVNLFWTVSAGNKDPCKVVWSHSHQ
ncbi:hypothetical protein OS493_032142 [Desmophyllum pertusum]|uniref:YqaJ viral recombinase domain-containing protein n=1 Tax=Desmophyllum pertusum TaxID=174260 RepID=A0A9W9Y8B8_9CNID|nr:hypothetical protein OS493_032142 [Desmophyllum pertusum]